MGNAVSGETAVTVGIPQGSILGPILYTRNLEKIADQNDYDIHLYADDNQLYTTFNINGDVETFI